MAGMRIVVCDYDSGVRSVLTGLCEEHGHRVLAETDNASDAVRLTERFKADALILDLALRVGRGQDALAELQAGAQYCHVLVFTAFAEGLEASRGVTVV